MAGLSDVINVTVDIATSKAGAALGDLKSKMAQTSGSGGIGGLKSAAQGLGDTLGALPFPAMAGAALGAGAVLKGLGDAFTASALEAKKMSDATGLSVESASEWIAAADDVGVSAETLEGAFGKAVKAIGSTPEKFAALGIELAHTKDGAIDMNGTLLNSIDVINGIQDPTKKAALAAQLYGKSWQELTPLLTQGSSAIRDTMAATSDAQRVTEDEVESAKKWQAVMDDLGDTLGDLKLTAGKLVVEGLTPLIESFAQAGNDSMFFLEQVETLTGGLVDAGNTAKDAFMNFSPPGQAFRALGLARDGVEALQGAWHDLTDAGEADVVVVHNLGDTTSGYGRTLQMATSRVVDAAAAEATTKQAKEDAATATEAATKASEARTKAIEIEMNAILAANDADYAMADSKDRIAELTAEATKQLELNTDANADNDVAQQQVDKTARDLSKAYEDQAGILANQMVAAQEAATGATATGIEKQALFAQALIETASTMAPDSPLRQHLVELASDINDKLPANKKINIDVDSAAAQQHLEDLIDKYNSIKSKTVFVDVQGNTHVNGAATGGPVSGLTLVGEEGPELVAFPRSGAFVFTAAESRRLIASGMATGGYAPGTGGFGSYTGGAAGYEPGMGGFTSYIGPDGNPLYGPRPCMYQPPAGGYNPVTSTSGTAGAINNSTYSDAQGNTSWTVPVGGNNTPSFSGGGGGGGGSGAMVNNITVYAGWGANGSDIGAAIVNELVKFQRSNGALVSTSGPLTLRRA